MKKTRLKLLFDWNDIEVRILRTGLKIQGEDVKVSTVDILDAPTMVITNFSQVIFPLTVKIFSDFHSERRICGFNTI